MGRFNDYNVGWLTVNRACNMRCSWCYSASSDFLKAKDMKLNDAKFAVDVFSKQKIKKIILIGGEPTIYPYLFEVIDYINSKAIECVIVSNGLRLCDNDFLQKIIEKDVKISLSIKSNSKSAYIYDTGVDCFDDISELVHKLNSRKLFYGVSYVISDDNVDQLPQTFEILEKLDTKSVGLSFCYSSPGNHITYNPKNLIDKFVTVYQKIKNSSVKFDVHFTLPVCLWPQDFIDEIKLSKQISTICQIHQKSGLIFDTNLDILACNALYEFPILKRNEYANSDELIKKLYSKEIIEIYEKLLRLPSKKCKDCEYLSNCGGGCVLNWQDFDLDSLLG